MSLDHHPHHEPHHTGHRWLDIGIAVCALIVSVASVGLTMVHGRTMEKMADANARLVEANSWPFVDYSTGNGTGSSVIDMTIANDGVGPAKIEAMELSWDGVAYPDGLAFLKACCGYQPAARDQMQINTVAGRVLRAGDQSSFIVLPKTDEDIAAFTRLNAARVSKDLNIRICYCSVFDECWENETARPGLEPKHVTECQVPKVPYDVPR